LPKRTSVLPPSLLLERARNLLNQRARRKAKLPRKVAERAELLLLRKARRAKAQAKMLRDQRKCNRRKPQRKEWPIRRFRRTRARTQENLQRKEERRVERLQQRGERKVRQRNLTSLKQSKEMLRVQKVKRPKRSRREVPEGSLLRVASQELEAREDLRLAKRGTPEVLLRRTRPARESRKEPTKDRAASESTISLLKYASITIKHDFPTFKFRWRISSL